jgi:hypothetical protein
VDWIERLFGISPDGGSGLTETLVALAVGLAVFVAGTAVFLRGRGGSRPWLLMVLRRRGRGGQ